MAIKHISVENPITGATQKAAAASGREKAFASTARSNTAVTMFAVALDVLGATAAAAIGVCWASRAQEPDVWLWAIASFVPTVVLFIFMRSLYRRSIVRRFTDEIAPVETTVAVASMCVLSVMTFVGDPERPGGLVARMWICAAVLIAVNRLILATLQRWMRRRLDFLAPTLIVGNGEVAHQLCQRLEASPQYGLAPVGLLSVDPPLWAGMELGSVPTTQRIGSPDSIEEAIEETGAEAVIIAFSRMQDRELRSGVVRVAHKRGLRVWVVPRMFDAVGQRVRVEHVGGLPVLALPHANPRGWEFTVKHVGDRVAAGLALVVIGPLLLVLAMLIRMSSPGPIFFRQKRVGRDGLVFDCLKFRSMRLPPAADEAFQPRPGSAPGGVEGSDRRTKIGRVLRATSMDELPQLINVLKGEMSLVGPRPERPEYVELFDAQFRRYGERHRVKAGLTGWAQVHGLRGQTSIADRAEWDNYYIENWSLALDFKILALTIPAVLRPAE